jgi:hypothetical protein
LQFALDFERNLAAVAAAFVDHLHSPLIVRLIVAPGMHHSQNLDEAHASCISEIFKSRIRTGNHFTYGLRARRR